MACSSSSSRFCAAGPVHADRHGHELRADRDPHPAYGLVASFRDESLKEQFRIDHNRNSFRIIKKVHKQFVILQAFPRRPCCATFMER